MPDWANARRPTDLGPASRIGASEVARVPNEVSEAALAHTIKDRVKAAYLRTDFFEQRKLLMEAWAAHCGSGRTAASSHKLDIPVADQAA